MHQEVNTTEGLSIAVGRSEEMKKVNKVCIMTKRVDIPGMEASDPKSKLDKMC